MLKHKQHKAAKVAKKPATKKVAKKVKKSIKKPAMAIAKRSAGGGAAFLNNFPADAAYKQKYQLYFDQQKPGLAQYGTEAYDHNFDHYMLDPSAPDYKTRNYMMMASTKAAYMGLGRSVVHTVIHQLQASADVLALASVECDLSSFEEGTTTTIKWRGKPIFIKNRTQEEIDISIKDDAAPMRDQQLDQDRVQKLNWLVVLGVCTHLGCVPIPGAGNYQGGFFCPCHGSHYDASGRIREGPAPLNLEVPPYKFIDDKTIVIG
eukprot:UN01466